MCTLNYTPMYFVLCMDVPKTSGQWAQAGQGAAAAGLIHANIFTFYLNTENCEYQDQEHKTLQHNMHPYQH